MAQMKNLSILVAALMMYSACAASEASSGQLTSKATMEAMAKVFARSEKVHSTSMSTIMETMSPHKAWQVLEKNNLTTPALLEMTSQVHGKTSFLRKADPKKGYAGIDGARKLLNDMILESMIKYDKETTECTEYYSQQCAAMEAARGQISASNYEAAESRTLILDAQNTIGMCEVDIPTRKFELKNHKQKCKDKLQMMKARLAVIEADIAVMTTILKMTDCDKKEESFIETGNLSMMRCEDPCTKKSFVTFNHTYLKQQVSQLQSSVSQKLMHDSFKDLFQGIESLQSGSFSQLNSQQSPVIKKTEFKNAPVPRTEIPVDPCTDPDAGAPSMADKNAAKCTITKSPQCYKLQERFLLIQSGIKDERDALLEDIASMDSHCKETTATFEAQIQDDQNILSEAQEKLGVGTEKEANAGEKARLTASQNKLLNEDLKKRMGTCSKNYINFETELCALKKIRGELYKMKGSGHSAFFVDCEVNKWEPQACSKECKRSQQDKDGEQKLVRSIMTPAEGGADCLPLEAIKKCNMHQCPVDCKLSSWNGWSKCSAVCGGGVQQRLREVERPDRSGGVKCGQTSQTRLCNTQSCEKDCELKEWTKWSWCSKDCDGGTRKREKFIHKAPKGEGACPGSRSSERLQYKECNKHECELAAGAKQLTCKKKLDIVFLLDGSGSLGETGWKAEIKAAEMFVDAFSGVGACPAACSTAVQGGAADGGVALVDGKCTNYVSSGGACGATSVYKNGGTDCTQCGVSAQANMAVILYSGPRTWGGVYKCFGKRGKKVDMEKTCKIKTVTHFTSDMPKVKKLITGLTWPKGSTLTSLALMRARAELSLGGKNSESIIVVITDGRPLSYRATGIASRYVRKAARLVWVPVTRYAPLKSIKKWATARWQENVVVVRKFSDLENVKTVDHVIANICPKH